MGTRHKKTIDEGITIDRQQESDIVVALAGNPNVGKSTLFNNLTGLKQHTGNWPGKTVCCAQGRRRIGNENYVFVDLPGTYSLMAHSAEEEVARDFICFGQADVTIVVCDATCLERNLNLVLQTIEITKKVVVCVNLMDEATKKGIHIDIEKLKENLQVPVISMSARDGKGVDMLLKELERVATLKQEELVLPKYIAPIEEEIKRLEPILDRLLQKDINNRFVALQLLGGEKGFIKQISEFIECDLMENEDISLVIREGEKRLATEGITKENITEKITACLVLTAESCCLEVTSCKSEDFSKSDRRLDKLLTSKLTGIPIMLLLLSLILWLTIVGANYPSQLLSSGFLWFQDRLTEVFHYFNAPNWLHGVLVLGVYRVVTWVIAVMLPPMAIFFPLFTLLEDFGYLPRVAFNLDHSFKKANTCGKQSLTMW